MHQAKGWYSATRLMRMIGVPSAGWYRNRAAMNCVARKLNPTSRKSRCRLLSSCSQTEIRRDHGESGTFPTAPSSREFLRSGPLSRLLNGTQFIGVADSNIVAEDRFQVPGAQYYESGRTYEAGDPSLHNDINSGKIPHWRAVYDDRGRIMVAICHNMDLGDAWEHSDEAEYKEQWASLAYRIAMNYFIYDLSH